MASIADKDAAVEAALEVAKRDARKQAHAKALGTAVTSSTVVRNFALVSDVVSERITGVIVDEQWSEARVAPDGKTLTIALTARVEPKAIAEGACVALRARHTARVAVVVADDDKHAPSQASTLLDELKGGCMTATLIHSSAAKIDSQELIADLRARSAGELALFIRDESTAAIGLSPKGAVTARIVDVATNEIVAVATGPVASVADALFQQVAKTWTKELNEGRRIMFSCKAASFSQGALLAKTVAKTLAVDGSKDQSLRNGELRFSLHVPMDGLAAAKKLDGVKVGAKKIDVTGAESGAVTLALVPLVP